MQTIIDNNDSVKYVAEKLAEITDDEISMVVATQRDDVTVAAFKRNDDIWMGRFTGEVTFKLKKMPASLSSIVSIIIANNEDIVCIGKIDIPSDNSHDNRLVAIRIDPSLLVEIFSVYSELACSDKICLLENGYEQIVCSGIYLKNINPTEGQGITDRFVAAFSFIGPVIAVFSFTLDCPKYILYSLTGQQYITSLASAESLGSFVAEGFVADYELVGESGIRATTLPMVMRFDDDSCSAYMTRTGEIFRFVNDKNSLWIWGYV